MHAFLDAVQAHGILRLGPADYLHVQQLLALRPDLQREELRTALASLLATNQEQWQQIARLFEQCYPTTSAPGLPLSAPAHHAAVPQAPLLADTSTPATSTARHGSPRAVLGRTWQRLLNAPRWLWYVLLLSGLGLGLSVLLVPLLQPPQPSPEARLPIPEPPPGPTPETQADWSLAPLLPARHIEVQQPAPLRPLDWRDGGTVALGALLVLLGLRWLRVPTQAVRARQAQAARRQQHSALERRHLAAQAERQQAHVALTYQVAQQAPLAPQVIDDAATLLGRLFHALRSDDLDIPATVQQSVAAAGRFSPRFADRPVARELTVLVDVERGAHPWLAGLTWVLERWHRLGVPLARYDFRFDPQWLSLHHTGNACTLRDLARHSEGGPLVLISRTLSTQGYDADAAWLRELNAWPVKAWLDPDPRPLAERPRVARQEIRRLEREHGVQRFPCSAEGLVALARYLAEDGQGVPAPAWPPLLPLDNAAVAAALPQWALLAALVPDATWEQLEAIRRHFPELSSALPEPSYVQRLIDWVAREDQECQPESEDGRTLYLSDALVDRLIRQQRRLDAGRPRAQQLEVRGRQLLLQQLDTTRPEDPLLEQFWELKRVAHRLYLEPEQALALVAPLLGSAVEPELLHVVAAELARAEPAPPGMVGIRSTLELLVGQAVDRVRPGELLGRPWRAWGVPGGVTCGVLLLAGLLYWYGPSGVQTWLRRPVQPTSATVLAPALQSVVKSVPAPLPQTVTNSIGMTLVLIQPGEFRMGSEAKEADNDEKPVHTVRLTKAFYLGQHEVTQGQWQAVMGNNPSLFTGDANRPVEQVSWDEVQEFFRRLNAREGGARYRLPTEAEWEYAARAGRTTAYSYGDDVRRLSEYAWYEKNAGGTTHPVGQRKPNAWGLYDMHGNVWEWVQDWLGPYPARSAEVTVDPTGPATGALRALRGGGWDLLARYARAAFRLGVLPGARIAGIGFRGASSVPSK